MDRINPPRAARPHHHLEPTPARAPRHRLRRALQPAPAAPIARAATTDIHHRHSAQASNHHHSAPNRPLRRPRQRIQSRCMTCGDRVSEPHRLRQVLRHGDDGRRRWHWDIRFLEGRADKILSAQQDTQRSDAIRTMLIDAARRVQVPTLVVRGAQSDMVSPETVREFVDIVPGSRFVDVADAGHMVACRRVRRGTRRLRRRDDGRTVSLFRFWPPTWRVAEQTVVGESRPWWSLRSLRRGPSRGR